MILSGVSLSPTACYLSRGALEEAKILGKRRDISDILADPRTDSLTRQKLRIVVAARRYAKDVIGLNAKESFTTYTRLDRDTLVLVLSAAYRDQLTPYTWWFPIVGRVPYKGYFDFNQARLDARNLDQEGYDTYLRPSDAFSTLGFFNDPLLSTTLNVDTLEIANTVIHELTHNTFYASGQVTFNESFASFVGARGAAAFFRSRGAPGAAAQVDARWEDDQLLAAFWTRLSHTLDSAFAAHPNDRAARLRARDSIYTWARQLLVDSVAVRFKTISPLYAERVQMDNASLLARRVYASELPLFDAVWEREEHDLRKTVVQLIALAKSTPEDPYSGIRSWVATHPPASAP
ncbi:MAG TPA: aminopeptidase [Gemmatimonadaceae bacterium]|nr:aminopeptidase [Gemmatimonadaceae bacterium]